MASTKDIGLGGPVWGCPFTLRFPVGADGGDLETGLAAAADSKVSLDGGAFADCTNEIVEIGTDGWYSITLEAAEMQASTVAYSVLSGDYGYHATLYPVRCGTVATGTAADGGAATLTLAAGSTIVDDEYMGYILQLTGGTGSGQAARIIDAAASTRVLTVQADWLTQPDATTTYAVLIPPERAMLLSTVAGDVAGLDGEAMRGTDGAYTGTPPTVEQIQSGLATSANQDTILARLGAWTGSAANTILGALRALATKAATLPTDIGGTYDPATDSLEAIRDTEPLGTATPTVEQIQSGLATAAAVEAVDTVVDGIAAKTVNLPSSPAAVGSAMTLEAGAITAATIAADAIDADALSADLDSYGARVEIIDDDAEGADRYCVTWLQNMALLTEGVTAPKLRVIALADGTDLVAETALDAVDDTGAYQYVETANRIVDGAAYLVLVTATIAAATRTWPHFIGRDSVAA